MVFPIKFGVLLHRFRMNIAEGCGRDSQAEMTYFFQIAMGSSSELEYQLILLMIYSIWKKMPIMNF